MGEEQDRALGRGNLCSAWIGVQLRTLPLKTHSPPPRPRLHPFPRLPTPSPTGKRTGARLPRSPPACSCIRAFGSASGQAGFHHPHLHLLGTIWLHLQDGLSPH